MCRVADEHGATAVPPVEFHPLDGAAVELLVTRERGQILWYRSAEAREALANAFQTAVQRVVEAR
jgi:hypothetical protein